MNTYQLADRFAERKHMGQLRKDGVTPYITHPRAVVSILRDEAGIDDIPTLTAAVLHDIIEDTGVRYEELAAEFGPLVAGIVRELSKDPALTQAEQKQAEIENAPLFSFRAGMIKIADKTANLRDIISCPPPWPTARKRAYYEHARAVVAAIGPRNPTLEGLFERTYRTGICQL